eukprot:scaffold427411_cov35-Prasinocladus_malaysianus.AAC.2
MEPYGMKMGLLVILYVELPQLRCVGYETSSDLFLFTELRSSSTYPREVGSKYDGICGIRKD